jgi:hypothetical protein
LTNSAVAKDTIIAGYGSTLAGTICTGIIFSTGIVIIDLERQ